MHAKTLVAALATLFGEVMEGPAAGGHMLNAGDTGMLGSLEKLSAAAASARTATGSSIAAHVDHVRYGLSLLNRWAAGEDAFKDADWAASWNRTRVTDDEWTRLRADLRAEASRWLEILRTPRDVEPLELNDMIASIAHAAYHLGAIRQINADVVGPAERPTPQR